jgi:hypothetical protein
MTYLAKCGHPLAVCPGPNCDADERDYQLDAALESFKPPYVPESTYAEAQEYGDIGVGEVRWDDDSIRKALVVAYLEGWSGHRCQTRPNRA